MKKIIIIGVLGILLAVGSGLSFLDWKNWRYEEMKNYGHGKREADVISVKPMYQNYFVGMRLKYPEGWSVKQNPKLADTGSKLKFEEVVSIGSRVKIVELGDQVTVSVERNDHSLVDIVDAEAAKYKLSREREYINSETLNIVILTWVENGVERQRALAKRETNKLIVVDQMRVGGWDAILDSMYIF